MSASWHLAIESSGLGGSVALFWYDESYQGQLHAQIVLPADRGSVRTLAPAIDQLLRTAQLTASQLSSLSVTSGPGSFTGLRVGLTTAKMLAWTAKLPVVPVDTLAAIAGRFERSFHRPIGPEPVYLVSAINAFRRQVFTSSWKLTSAGSHCELPSTVVDADAWLANPWQGSTSEEDRSIWISGGALGTYTGIDSTRFQLADSGLWQPLAEHVGMLGLAGLAAGRAVSAHQLAPNYIRASAAEENVRKTSPD